MTALFEHIQTLAAQPGRRFASILEAGAWRDQTYADLWRRALSFAGLFRASGLAPDDVVCLIVKPGADAYAIPAQKWLLGPEGMGALAIGPAARDRLRPAFAGGCSSSDTRWRSPHGISRSPSDGEGSKGRHPCPPRHDADP